MAITLKIGDVILPLNIRIVSKQGRGNTDKPTCFRTMIEEVLDVFDAEGIDLRKYPITFDSWYGSKALIEALLELGFTCILAFLKTLRSQYLSTFSQYEIMKMLSLRILLCEKLFPVLYLGRTGA